MAGVTAAGVAAAGVEAAGGPAVGVAADAVADGVEADGVAADGGPAVGLTVGRGVAGVQLAPGGVRTRRGGVDVDGGVARAVAGLRVADALEPAAVLRCRNR